MSNRGRSALALTDKSVKVQVPITGESSLVILALSSPAQGG